MDEICKRAPRHWLAALKAELGAQNPQLRTLGIDASDRVGMLAISLHRRATVEGNAMRHHLHTEEVFHVAHVGKEEHVGYGFVHDDSVGPHFVEIHLDQDVTVFATMSCNESRATLLIYRAVHVGALLAHGIVVTSESTWYEPTRAVLYTPLNAGQQQRESSSVVGDANARVPLDILDSEVGTHMSANRVTVTMGGP